MQPVYEKTRIHYLCNFALTSVHMTIIIYIIIGFAVHLALRLHSQESRQGASKSLGLVL